MLNKEIVAYGNRWNIGYDYTGDVAIVEEVMIAGCANVDLTELLDTRILEGIEDQFYLSLETGFREAA